MSEETYEKIMKGMEGKCLKKPNFFVASTFASFGRERRQCEVDAMGEASILNGFTNEWEEYEPKFKQKFDAWKQCDNFPFLKRIL